MNSHSRMETSVDRPRMTRRDPQLRIENRTIMNQYPFFYHKNDSNPISSRVRSSLRTLAEFDNIQKLSLPSPEELLKIEQIQNPYKQNRDTRKKTKNSFKDSKVDELYL